MNQFILKTPSITEKTYKAMSLGIYTFIVGLHATKGQIKEAVESTFGVHVTGVRTTMVHGQYKKTGRRRTLVSVGDRKKAVVTLKKGEKIEVLEVATE